ncbi:MAG: hypothetical protein U1E89_06095 [Burkholderiaceae bacterium]
MPMRTLAELERRRLEFGADAAAARLRGLRLLARTRLASAAAVRRLHELLCFIRAYPDDAAVRAQAARMLDGFAQRADLRAHATALATSGIAGTAIHFRFFAAQAQWLAALWPAQLSLDRRDRDADERIARALQVLLEHAEGVSLREVPRPGFATLDRLRGRDETDAVFLLRRIAAMPGDGFTREAFSDAVDASYTLAPGPGTPSRSTAVWPKAPLVFRRTPPPRARPDLRAELQRPPRRVRRLPLADGQALIDLARGAMVTRERSLEAFAYADARDAWLVDDGDGLAYAFAGVVPERRHAVFSYYGALTLRNGVPIGYTQADVLGPSAALSFNTFESFRGAEAAHTFARWLAALRALFGCTSFTIEPYQLGAHNDEAIASGAWWFYAKLGFVPRDAATRALAKQERERQQRRPSHRTSPAMLARLAQRHLYFDLDPAAPRPLVTPAMAGDAVSAALVSCGARDADRGVHALASELWHACAPGLRPPRGSDAWRAWQRLAPLLARLPLARWTAGERLALVALARGKAGRSERAFVRAWQAHAQLDAALLRLWARGR